MTEELAGTTDPTAPESPGAAPAYAGATPAASTLAAAEAGSTEVDATVSAPEKTAEPAKVDWRTDPEVQHAIKVEADRLAQQRMAKAKLKAASQDASLALEFVQEEHAALEAESDPIKRLQAMPDEDRAAYGNWWLEENRAEADRMWNRDPAAYPDWVQGEIARARETKAKAEKERFEAAVAAEVKRQVATVAKAEADHMTAEALKAYPTAPTGTAGQGVSDDALLAAYARGEIHDHERIRKILDGL